eukprot:TRINITY_DN236_c0_g4_i1.p1 TRINITY_DN236_c0_g4~~TRINITY_DN236_c0_g4_i1.p1  ORF type:complete len:165 (-),score=33.33 TRINITY_DN236_c0_g4_i1:193-687(-)
MIQLSQLTRPSSHHHFGTATKSNATLWVSQISVRNYFDTTQEPGKSKSPNLKFSTEKSSTDWSTETNSTPAYSDTGRDTAKVSVAASTDDAEMCTVGEEQLQKVDLACVSFANYGVCESSVQTDCEAPGAGCDEGKVRGVLGPGGHIHCLHINKMLEEDIGKRQ